MGARYPHQVGGHKPCVPVVVVMDPGPRLGPFMFGHDGGRCVFGRHRATQYYPKGSESEWPGECHASRTVLSERRWSTRMGVRGHEFRGVDKVCYLCRVWVLNLSIVASSVTGTSL